MDDMHWYLAEVNGRNDDDTYTVSFTEYGNSQTQTPPDMMRRVGEMEWVEGCVLLLML